MSRIVLGSARHLHPAWPVFTVLVATIVACSGESPTHGAAPGRGVYVAAIWQVARSVKGHEVHVVTRRIACAACHELTSDSIGTVNPARCTTCHQKEARIEHARGQAEQRFGSGAKADCTTCHAFTRIAERPPHQADYESSECARCHRERQGDTPGVKVHGTSECVSCHKPHEDAKPKPGNCSDCHHDVKTSHAARGRTVAAICTTCHQHQHAPASDSLSKCATCHATIRPTVPATALFADGHSKCVGCHRPHTFEKSNAVACRSCHEDVIVMGAPKVREHERCTSCHAPHDVRGSPDRACAGCHRDVHPDHPKHGATATCIGCHDPHPSKTHAEDRARSCSGCHQTAASDHAFHGGTACTRCHAPHDFVREVSDRTTCQACHAKELALVATNSSHQTCEKCHGGLPHRPTTLGVGCESCHSAEHAQANTGHVKCLSCHEPHGGKVGVGCASCHAKERDSAPAAHRDCQRCHQPHSGSTANVGCASCHASEAKTPHGGIAQGCTTCHRAHGPSGPAKPPACATCHGAKTLFGLHRIEKHADCARCHTGHGESTPKTNREACLACHADRKNHFPDAPRCANCHLFSPTR